MPITPAGSSPLTKVTSLPSGSRTRRVRNRSASVVVEETKSRAAAGPVISASSAKGSVVKVRPSPSASKSTLSFSDGSSSASRVAAGVQVELGPAGPGERPLLLRAQFEAAVDVSDVEVDRRLPVPAGVLALQEVPEEPLLQGHAVVGVELGEVFEAVDLQPLVVRGDTGIALETAAGVQMVGPVGRRQHRDGDLLQIRRALSVVLVVEGVDPAARPPRQRGGPPAPPASGSRVRRSVLRCSGSGLPDRPHRAAPPTPGPGTRRRRRC